MSRIITDKIFYDRLNKLDVKDYLFLDKYRGNIIPIRVKHLTCNNIYKVSPNNFIGKGTRCPFCYGNHRKTPEEFSDEVHKIYGNKYEILDPYVNATTSIRVVHLTCGTMYKVKPYSFIKGHECRKCSNKSKGVKISKALTKSNDLFIKQLEANTNNSISSVEEYKGATHSITFKCNNCNHVFLAAPTDVLSHNTRCPYCKASSGEQMIINYLDSKGIDYEFQKKFDDLKDSTFLSYDFYIPSFNLLIEYQGEQHYHPIKYMGGEEKFKLQKEHDRMKAEYAEKHNIKELILDYKNHYSYKEISNYLDINLKM